jgi:hypothetical protein
MKVTVKKRALQEVLEKIAEARSSHSVNINQLALDPTPVSPVDTSANQIFSTPKYKDPAFTPVTPSELGDELSAMARSEVDPNRVKRVFKMFKKMIGEEEEAINEARRLISTFAANEIES